MECPICANEADSQGDRDYGDKERWICPRCGPYELSGTAKEMLPRRLAATENGSARLSHAVRIEPTADDDWFMITSANLDELLSRPLPPLAEQLKSLLSWLSAKVKEDPLGDIPIPRSEDLAGMLGALNGDRVSRLMAYAEESGLIEYPAMGKLRLVPDISIEADEEALLPDSLSGGGGLAEEVLESGEIVDEVVSAHCNNCGGPRDAFVRGFHNRQDGDQLTNWSDSIEILECCGCHELSVRKTEWFSEWDQRSYNPLTGEVDGDDGAKVTLWPAATQRAQPDWVNDIDDVGIRSVLDEVYCALEIGASTLAAIGIRTVLDAVMLKFVGDVQGGFAGKVDTMIEHGLLGAAEKDTLMIMIDVGSAAAHRAHQPDQTTLNRVLDAAESLLHRLLIVPSTAEAVRSSTPRRAET